MRDRQKIDSEEIGRTLGITDARESRYAKRVWLIIAVSLIAAAALAFLYRYYLAERSAPEYITEKAAYGTLTVTVSATGNLEPTNKVDVGTEVSGTIKTVLVDYNDAVEAGQVIARLDTTKLKAKVESSKAALLAAKAALAEAEVKLADATNERTRTQELFRSSKGKYPSDKELDAARYAYELAVAQKAYAEAQIEQAKATLNADEDDLAKAAITAPVDGIVLVRNVEPGQTVAATLQTPVLFTIAESMTQMDLVVSVDEADVGQVHEGQRATFSVDAYPEHTFEAQIAQVRLNSKIVEGVVTYEALMSVDNSRLLLRPGMTATADIIVRVLEKALLVPNAALRYTPPKNETAPSDRKDEEEQLWILKENTPVKVNVRVEASDGLYSAVQSDALAAGTAVITGSKAHR